MKKTKLVLAIAAATLLTGAMVSTEATADVGKSAKHKAKHKVKRHRVKAAKVNAVEAAPVTTMAPVAAPAAVAYDDSALKQRIAELENRPAPVAKERTKDNMVFFRGGYAQANRHRNGVSIQSNVAPIGGGVADKEAWYFGAGLDFSVDDSLFGLMPNTEVLAEVMFEYKEFNDHVSGNALAMNPTPLAAPGNNVPRAVTVSQFTLNASPKIKFMKGSDFRPWVIPVGFAMNVISPPSESITVLQPAMQFGVGADYRLWKNIYVGADARYQQNLGRTLDGVPTNGFSAGGYLGLGF